MSTADVRMTPKHIGANDLPTDMTGIFAEPTYGVAPFP